MLGPKFRFPGTFVRPGTRASATADDLSHRGLGRPGRPDLHGHRGLGHRPGRL